MTTCERLKKDVHSFSSRPVYHILLEEEGRADTNLQYHSTQGQSWDCSWIKRHKFQVGMFFKKVTLFIERESVCDLINWCCFLCLIMTLLLRKLVILSYFCTRPLRHWLQIIWNNWIIFYAPPPVKISFSQFAAHVHTLEMRRQLHGRSEAVI